MFNWLRISVISLALSGLYSIAIVLLRIPGLSKIVTDKSVFKSALIIHVDLSVLVWFLSITCFFWCLNGKNSFFKTIYSNLAIISLIMIAVSPLLASSIPIMNNYVPILENVIFITALALFGTTVIMFAIQTLYESIMGSSSLEYGDRIISFVKSTTAFMYIAVWVCFYLSYVGIVEIASIVPLDMDYYYEMMFWSGGHLLQFIYTQIYMIILLILAESCICGRVKYSNFYEFIFLMNFILALTLFIGHYKFSLADGEFKLFFTKHMIYLGGVAPSLFISVLVFDIYSSKRKIISEFNFYAFIFSVLLFGFGGILAIFISGVNVSIPAHYHGSIVGISIAMMGLVYVIIFRKKVEQNVLHYDSVINKLYNNLDNIIPIGRCDSLAKRQLWIITIGQIMHISGLALAGGYGVMRKTPGMEVDMLAKIYMGMMGLGGLIAIIGGLIFIYICAKNMFLKEIMEK